MNIVATIMQALGRRREQLHELEAKREQLDREHKQAVRDGDDLAADKLHARIEKVESEIRAAQAALAEQQRMEAEQRQAAASAECAARLAEVHRAADLYRARALDFDAAVNGGARLPEALALPLAELWHGVQEAFEAMRAAAVHAGVPDPYSSRGLAPGRVWNMCWGRFLRDIQIPERPPITMPSGGATSAMPSVAEFFSKEDRAAAAQQSEEKEAT